MKYVISVNSMQDFVCAIFSDDRAIEFELSNGIIAEAKYRGWCVELNFERIEGNANKAVKRKVVRFAKKLHLRAYYDRWRNWIILPIRGRKDWHRCEEIIKYMSGKKFAKTAANNC